MSEYTPTTEEIRYRLILGADPFDLNADEREDLEEFDRWLNSVKAEAWDAGHEAFEEAWRSDHLFPYDYATENPYRTGGAE